MKILVFFCLFFLIPTEISCDTECFNLRQENLDHHLATKTPYRVVANKNDEKVIFDDCTPTRAWGIFRHGTRNPSRKQLFRMRTTLSEYRDIILDRGKLCDIDKERFRTWNIEVDDAEQKFLVPEGEMELIELAERIQNRFPGLFYDQYDNLTYRFKYTDTQRAKKSAESFATGLFGRENIRQVWYPRAESRDPILRVSCN